MIWDYYSSLRYDSYAATIIIVIMMSNGCVYQIVIPTLHLMWYGHYAVMCQHVVSVRLTRSDGWLPASQLCPPERQARNKPSVGCTASPRPPETSRGAPPPITVRHNIAGFILILWKCAWSCDLPPWLRSVAAADRATRPFNPIVSMRAACPRDYKIKAAPYLRLFTLDPINISTDGDGKNWWTHVITVITDNPSTLITAQPQLQGCFQ